MRNRILTIFLATTMLLGACMINGCGEEFVEETEAQVNVDDDKDVVIENAKEVVDGILSNVQNTENDTVTATDAYSVYMSFMGMGDKSDFKAIVDEEAKEYREELPDMCSYDDLLNWMEDKKHDDSNKIENYYAILNIEGSDILALKFDVIDNESCKNMDGNMYGAFRALFLKYYDEELHVTDMYRGNNQGSTILESGFIDEKLVAGEGRDVNLMMYTGVCIDSDGKVDENELYRWEWATGAWCISDMIHYRDKDIYNNIAEVYGKNGKIDIDTKHMALSAIEIDGTENIIPEVWKGDDYTAEDKLLLEELKKQGVKLVYDKSIDELIDEKLKNNKEIDRHAAPVVWNVCHESDYELIPMKLTSGLSDWNYEEIIGREFVPNDTLKRKMTEAEKNKIDSSMLSGDMMDYDKKSEVEVFFVEESMGFKYYFTSYDEAIVATQDGKFVLIKDTSMCDFIWQSTPKIDFFEWDNDNEDEIIITNILFHGTGLNQPTVVIIDKVYKLDDYPNFEGNEWCAIHLTPRYYVEAVNKLGIEFYDLGDEIAVKGFKGEITKYPKTQEGRVECYMDALVEKKDIGLYTMDITPVIMVKGDNGSMGMMLDPIEFNFNYLGDNKWTAYY